MILSNDLTSLMKVEKSDIKAGRLEVPEGIKIINNQAVQGLSQIRTLILPDSLEEIGYQAFRGCKGLKSVTLTTRLKRIDWLTFQNCTALVSVKLPNSLKKIANGLFIGCASLSTVTFPDSIEKICWGSFQGCRGLTTLTLPDALETIEADAFRECTALRTVVFGASLASVDHSAFRDCPDIRDILIDTDNKENWSRIVSLLPEELKPKVLSFESGMAILEKKKNIEKSALLKFLSTPSIAGILCGINLATPLYELPLEIISLIQSFRWDDTAEAQALLDQIKQIPFTVDGDASLTTYESQVSTCVEEFIKELLHKAQEQPEKKICVYPQSYQGRLKRHVNLLQTMRNAVLSSRDYSEDQKNKTKEKMEFDIALSLKLIEKNEDKRLPSFSEREQQALSQASFQGILKNTPNENTFFKRNAVCDPDTRPAKVLQMFAS